MSRILHHANLLIGTPEEAESYLRLVYDDLGINLLNNPNLFVFKTEVFGIDEARILSSLSSRKAITPALAGQVTNKIFIITPTRLTLEAQNALLKTFEDPFPHTYFFMSVREEGLVIPTLRSRMQVLKIFKNSISESNEAEIFLSSPIKNRLLFAKSFVDEGKNLSVFLDNLLFLLRKQNKKKELLEKVYKIRCLVNDSLVAPRLVIEHLSLVL